MKLSAQGSNRELQLQSSTCSCAAQIALPSLQDVHRSNRQRRSWASVGSQNLRLRDVYRHNKRAEIAESSPLTRMGPPMAPQWGIGPMSCIFLPEQGKRRRSKAGRVCSSTS